jgi:DNA segregation ATPase FtsK/SpoIIIE, S-DNA-T family
LPTLGIAADTLAEIGFDPTGTLLIAGPPQSGRTTALLTAVHSLQRCQPARRLVYFGTRRSPLVGSTGPAWDRIVLDLEEVAEVAREWTLFASSPQGGPALGAVIENVPAFADTPAQEPLEQLVAAFAAAGHTVIGDGETSALTSSWGLPRAMKSGRHGLLLQPDSDDGDSVLRTTFPRMLRADFPPGRGMYVRSGRIRKVQVALPG